MLNGGKEGVQTMATLALLNMGVLGGHCKEEKP